MSGAVKFPQIVRGNYIRGEFRQPADPQGEWKAVSPGNHADSIGVFRYGYADVDIAVAAALQAFSAWRKVPLSERVAKLKSYQAVLKRRSDELAEVIAREVGKPVWEAKTEVSAMINKVDVTIQDSLPLVAEKAIPDIMPKTVGRCAYRPLGVMAVIGPFNFPGHLPNGHIVPALITGNTVVFKPSEKTSLIAQLMAECFHEAGLPPGAFNVVVGEKEVGRRLCVHEGVAGILFTGSYEVGTRIKQDTLLQHWKLLALEMGGKNAAIVWNDVDLMPAVRDVLVGAFLTTGQRCSATSRVLVHEDVFDSFVQKLHERAKAFSIGDPLKDPFMGALIDSAGVDRYLKFQGIAQREGYDVIMRGKAFDPEPGLRGHFVTPSIFAQRDPSLDFTRKSVLQQTEIFSPALAVLKIRSLEDAIAQANATQYGLAASVFTASHDVYARCAEDVEAGQVNWNRPTVGASSRLPFGGLKKSGNFFPTALTSPFYCTHPVASLETAAPETGPGAYTGLNWA